MNEPDHYRILWHFFSFQGSRYQAKSTWILDLLGGTIGPNLEHSIIEHCRTELGGQMTSGDQDHQDDPGTKFECLELGINFLL